MTRCTYPVQTAGILFLLVSWLVVLHTAAAQEGFDIVITNGRIITWFYNRSGANLLTVVIFHAAMNTFPFVLLYYAPAMALVILLAGAVVVTDRMWRRLEAQR